MVMAKFHVTAIVNYFPGKESLEKKMYVYVCPCVCTCVCVFVCVCVCVNSHFEQQYWDDHYKVYFYSNILET